MRGSGPGRAGSKKHAPLHVRDQDTPEPERLRRPAEEAGMAPYQRDDPPQAEGDRDDEAADDAGKGSPPGRG